MFPQQIIIVAGYWKSIRGTIVKLGCKFKKIDFKHCKAYKLARALMLSQTFWNSVSLIFGKE